MGGGGYELRREPEAGLRFLRSRRVEVAEPQVAEVLLLLRSHPLSLRHPPP